MQVSRSHALLSVVASGSSASATILKLQDMGSKFGVFINGTACTTNQEIVLKDGDLIELARSAQRPHEGDTGVADETQPMMLPHLRPPSTWTPTSLLVRYVPHRMFIAGYSRKIQEELTRRIIRLGGSVVAQLPEATHLLCKSGALTSKVIMALILGIQIVSEAFLAELSSRSSLSQPLPEPRDFVPLDEDGLPSLDDVVKLHSDRKTLFNGLTFVLPSQYLFYKPLDPLITAAGGQLVAINPTAQLAAELSEHSLDSSQWASLRNSNTCWVHPLKEIGATEPKMNQDSTVSPQKEDGEQSWEMERFATIMESQHNITWTYQRDIIRAIVLASISPFMYAAFTR